MIFAEGPFDFDFDKTMNGTMCQVIFVNDDDTLNHTSRRITFNLISLTPSVASVHLSLSTGEIIVLDNDGIITCVYLQLSSLNFSFL